MEWATDMEESPSDREGNDFRPHAMLVMMVVIGVRAANYIKLVAEAMFHSARITGICNLSTNHHNQVISRKLFAERPNGDGKHTFEQRPRDLDAWLASRWALRTRKETAEPLETCAELSHLKSAIKERIGAARALRAKQGQLIHDLSATMQMLVQNSDVLSKALDSMPAREACKITRVDYAALGHLPALIETQRHSSEKHRFMTHSATDAI
jgi:hypothetical protein